MNKKTILVILDGFGHSEEKAHNAVELAKAPNYRSYLKQYPHALLDASGEAVGLPRGIMGNSEVGHLSIGSGRVILQDMTRIGKFADEKGFETLPDFKRLLTTSKGNLHFIGLVSDGGVHSDVEHLYKMLNAVGRINKIRKVYIHVITDGRDTPPLSGFRYVQKLQEKVQRHPNIKIATVLGRFFAMDRDKRWERINLAYRGLTEKSETEFPSAVEAIQDAYDKQETDEFITPRQIHGGAQIQNGDQVVFFNFRADRAREISTAFAIKDFKEFPTPVKIEPQNWVTFTRYQEQFPFPYLFEPQKHTNILGEVIAKESLPQLRIAETEKYAHVTYFFNGGLEEPLPLEERIMIPSPKEVATYDLKPEMSARKITDQLIEKLEEKEYKLVVVNYANGDMVGHTGVEKAAIEAVNVMDECLGKLVKVAMEKDYEVFITADHGNCEQMVDPETGGPMTAHTTNLVPLILISERFKKSVRLRDGTLADVAPTILDLYGWQKPKEMSGRSLIMS